MGAVEKITIALTPEMAGFVRETVRSGEFASTSEAIRDAVREWKERRNLLGYTVEELRELVHQGIDSGPSEHSSIDEVIEQARQEFRSQTSR